MTLAIIRFDMRQSPSSTLAFGDFYREALDMAAFADERGLDMIVLSEHHGDEGGFSPSPLILGAAIAGRTARIAMTVSALLVPLHDPIRLAEDLAVLDNLSAGRIAFVTGIGYRPAEYHLLQKEWKRRGKMLDRSLEVMLQAWTGEPFEYEGETVQVLPAPVQKPHIQVYVGGSSPVAAKRAARFGLDFFPSAEDDALAVVYEEECRRLGREPGYVSMPKGPAAVLVSEDPDRAWAEIGHLLLEDAMAYNAQMHPDMRSQAQAVAETPEALREEGVYRILSPDEAVTLGQELGPMAGFSLHPLCGGLPPEYGWETLELIADKVLPALGRH